MVVLAEIAVQKGCDVQWVFWSTVNCGLRHSELEIRGQFKTQLAAAQIRLWMQVLPVLPHDDETIGAGEGRGLKLQPSHVSYKTFEANVAQKSKNPGQSKGANPINSEHVVQRSSVVCEDRVSPFAGAPP